MKFKATIKWMFFLWLLLPVQSAFSQNELIDSLKRRLVLSSVDSELIAVKNSIAYEYRQSSPDTALILARESYTLSSEINDEAAQLNSLYILAKIFIHQNYDSAHTYFKRAENLAIELKDYQQLIDVLDTHAKSFNPVTEKDSALHYLQAALQISKMNDLSDQQFFILNSIGRTYKYNGEYPKAEDHFLQALSLQKKIGNVTYQAGILQNLGNNAGDANDLDKAIAYYQESLKLMETLEDKEGIALILSLIAYHYMQKGYYPLSLDYYQKSLSQFDQLENNAIIIQDLRGIGVVYEAMEDYPKALTYYQQVLDIRERDNQVGGQVDILNDIGRNYALRSQYDTAIHFYTKTLNILRETDKQKVRTSETRVYIGSCYEKLNQLDSASTYLQNGLTVLQSNKQFNFSALGLISLGRMYKKQGKFTQSKEKLEEALAISQAAGFRELQMDASQELYELYDRENNYEQALRHYKNYQTLQDSLFNVKNTENLIRLETDFEIETEKQRLAFERKQELGRQKSFRIIMLLALLTALLIIVLIARYSQQKRKANEELQQLNEQVSQQKEKLEELDVLKSQFFTNISHEFRTPLTIISGMIEQIKTKPELWLERGSEMIKQNTLSLLNLVNQILDLRKLESGTLKLNLVQGDIIQYLRYITESYQSYSENNAVRLHFLAMRPTLIMDYDPDKLLRVISNMLSNAVKYTPEDGQIYLHIDQKKDGQNNELHIHIQDTGPGIPEKELRYIFDRFYQVKDSGHYRGGQKNEGTGIGLALTQEFIQLMNGEIEVSSVLNEGTTFLIKLPITNNSTISGTFSQVETPVKDTSEIIHSKSAQDIAEKPLLLIVEDNPDVQQFLVACLEEDYQLQIADNGQKGIDAAIEQVPALIVSDVMMPEKDGFELCETLKKDERTSHIPIILLTAKADMDSKISGLERGADAYLTKPFEQRELLVRLEKLHVLRMKLQEQYRSLEPSGNHPVEDSFIQKVRRAIEENMDDENFGTPQLCRAVTLSRAQLHNKIKALTGLSTSIFIRSIRLKKAKSLLETTDLKVSEIAYSVGFKNPSYFSNAYSEQFGISPSKTRK